MILPPASLGIFGGGQLGRMFVIAARTMGYHTIVFEPDSHSPAGTIADEHLCCNYDDEAALDNLVDRCGALTLEFENVPLTTLQYVESKGALLHPASHAVAVAQDRIKEKAFLNKIGAATVPCHPVYKNADIEQGFADLKPPLLLKTARFGYDGKGQSEVATASAAQDVFSSLNVTCILEEKVTLKKEVSVLVVRDRNGDSISYPIAENVHRRGILHSSTIPAQLSVAQANQVRQIAGNIAEALNYCGILAVEFFITDNDELYVNEIAPRPHNSGHYTLDASMSCQFTQQVRMMCGLPAGATELTSPAVMVNILGDAWNNNAEPNWDAVLRHPHAYLHLYGKREARAGRKMGHFCLLGEDRDQLGEQAEAIHHELMNHGR